MESGLGETKPSVPDFDYPRFLRDVTSLLALPAFWGGTDPAFVLGTLLEALEALEALLALQACYGVATVRADERCAVLRVAGKVAVVSDRDWAPIVALAGDKSAGEGTDSGVGLAHELAPHVFDVFVQGRQGLARSEGGLGIGLAVVKRLVQAHGGTVAVHSDGPDRGSEFSVKLPALTDHVTQGGRWWWCPRTCRPYRRAGEFSWWTTTRTPRK